MEIKKIHADGLSVSEIARRLDLGRKTVLRDQHEPRINLARVMGAELRGPNSQKYSAITPALLQRCSLRLICVGCLLRNMDLIAVYSAAGTDPKSFTIDITPFLIVILDGL